jgi:hypothetical protein
MVVALGDSGTPVTCWAPRGKAVWRPKRAIRAHTAPGAMRRTLQDVLMTSSFSDASVTSIRARPGPRSPRPAKRYGAFDTAGALPIGRTSIFTAPAGNVTWNVDAGTAPTFHSVIRRV